jgi:predicted amino acid racemase
MMAVTKVFCADHHLVDILIEEGVDYLADSRIQNLKALPETDIPKVLLRIPSHHEVDDVVRYSDISLNSEWSTIQLLHYAAGAQNRTHNVVLMIDQGDLREGIFDQEELDRIVEKTLALEHINLYGIGVNLTCYGGVIPTTELMLDLVYHKERIEAKHGITLAMISGGNSSSLDLVLSGKMPSGINNLRLGESIVLGRETAYGDYLDGTFNDVFVLVSDIIEMKVKPSVPIGQIGMNAFGKTPTFIDKGDMRRAIINCGKQDVDHTELVPFDTIDVLGSSSDHILLDMSDTTEFYEVGSQVHFRLTYSSILSLMTSPYVEKQYVD